MLENDSPILNLRCIRFFHIFGEQRNENREMYINTWIIILLAGQSFDIAPLGLVRVSFDLF